MKTNKALKTVIAGIFILGAMGFASLHAQVQLTLQISPQTISFAAEDPDMVPVITADRPVHVTMRITGNGNRPWRLTLRADGDLEGFWFGFFTIGISNVRWTATPVPPFQNGTLVANVGQPAAGGNGNLNDFQGDITFTFQNLWTYRAENYSQTVTFILSAP